MLMHLQSRDSPHVVHATLYSSLQGTTLSMTIHQDHHLLSSHDSTDTHRERCLWHLIHIIIKETTVGNNGICSQCLLTSTTGQAGTWLIESDMAIGTDTTKEEVDTTEFLYFLLVVGTLCSQIRRIAIEDMNIFLRTVDMVEQVCKHERVVALRMLYGQTYILVHIKGYDILE